MKPFPNSVTFALLSWILVFFSCKKEIQSERNSNKPPIASAGSDQVITLPTDTVSLDGNASKDPDGTITNYLWTKIAGPASFNIQSAALVKTVVNNLSEGTYQFELKITDNEGLIARDTMSVVVDAILITNHPPMANAGVDQTIILPANTVAIDGKGCSDPEMNIVSYIWTKISGPPSFNIANANVVRTQVTNLVEGIYQFELKVTDAGGLLSKDTVNITVNAAFPACDVGSRTVVDAWLTPIGNLSQARGGFAIASAGDKILFAGGANGYDLSSTVDIYDVNTKRWSIATLSVPRYATTAVAAGNKIFFAGGYNGDEINPITYSTVDIYDASANTWSVTSMSVSAGGRAAAVLNNKIFFAGGFHSNGLSTSPNFPATVDIYNLVTSTWSTAQLSEGREGLSATTAGSKIYFAGGLSNNSSSNKIDIYNGNDATWSVSTLSQARGYMASITIGDKIYWAGGAVNYQPNSNTVEIRNINTQASSFACLFQPNAWFDAVLKNNKIVFFTGAEWVPHSKNKFDIYDVTTDTWSIGVLNQDIAGATIITVKDIIYVALDNRVWKLDF